MGMYLTDDAINSPEGDFLHFSDFQPALKELLTTAKAPLTVGIFGPWGSGKTSLMRMLHHEIESEERQSVRTVWFTAWKYDRQDILWRAFILRVLHALYPRELGEGTREARPILTEDKQTPTQQEQVALLTQLEKNVYETIEWQELGPRAIRWWQFLSNTGTVGTEIAATVATGGLYPQLKKLFDNDVSSVEGIQKAAEAISHQVTTLWRHQLLHMEQFEETFQKVVQLLGQEGRLVVFVDDLDRCLPEKAIEVLEAIKLFLEVQGAVFVLGMDREIVEKGIETHYKGFARQEPGLRKELPIRGDIYLQKIVQIPFHLPALATTDLESLIRQLDSRLPVMTQRIFAKGLFPNPRQVKRALNIFSLLQRIAKDREARGGLPKGSISWTLLAKTIIVQTQYPELYQQWRQYPMLLQVLEAEYISRPKNDEEILFGRLLPRNEKDESEQLDEHLRKERAQARSTGLLNAYLTDHQQYALLARMLSFPDEKEVGTGRNLAHFAGLSRSQMAAYVRLAGAVETEPEQTPMDLPTNLMEEILCGDKVRMQDALAYFKEQEKETDGHLHHEFRARLISIIQDHHQIPLMRVSAGSALSDLSDNRFRTDAWYLPNEPLLGFVKIPTGSFLMGSDPEQDPQAQDDELPQHEITLPAYYINRYLVTIDQFRIFIVETGQNPRFTDSAASGSFPIVRITWGEAIAYCDWLNEKLREWEYTPEPLRILLCHDDMDDLSWRITLPSEAEWEKAARSEDGRCYPWGNHFDPTRANTQEAGIGVTSVVGCFPGGASPYGLLDTSGNVWEWTRSLWSERMDGPDYKYPYQRDDGRERLKVSNAVRRVLRGGSFYNERSQVRCASRLKYSPNLLNWDFGFRIAIALIPSNVEVYS